MPFKDTPDGQTYHDPEAERKARENTLGTTMEEIWSRFSNGDGTMDLDQIEFYKICDMVIAQSKTDLLNALIEREESKIEEEMETFCEEQIFNKGYNNAKQDTIDYLNNEIKSL